MLGWNTVPFVNEALRLIAEMLLMARTRRGQTTGEFAGAARRAMHGGVRGLSQSNYSKLEHGEFAPTPEQIDALYLAHSEFLDRNRLRLLAALARGYITQSEYSTLIAGAENSRPRRGV